MIGSRQDYKFYLEADKIALGLKRKRPRIVGEDVWKFQRILRRVEYFHNCKKRFIWKLYYMYLQLKYYRLSVKLGFTIPPNVFGPGLCIVHRGTIVVAKGTKVGSNCRMHVCVNIGTKAGFADQVPTIGNNVYIGPGAKIMGNIEIADWIAVGANAVVNRSFTEQNISIAGVPAKKINDEGSEKLLTKATEHLRNR